MLFVWSVALARPQAVDIEAGGEIWTAYELYVAENFGAVEQDDSGALVVRASADLEVHVGPQVIGMVQLKSTAEVGRDGGALPINQNPLDLHQGYLEAWTGDRPTRLEWRVGRQELLYGRGSFVDVRNGLANRRSFDAVRLRAHTPKLLIDAFGALEVSIQPGVFDDGAAPDVPRPRLWGTVAQVFPDRSLGVDVSYAGVSQPGVVYVAGAGDETRHLGNVRGFVRTRHVRLDVEATLQGGTLVTAEVPLAIRAFGLQTVGSFRLSDSKWKPSLQAAAGYHSGDGDPADDVLGTYRAPFPNLRYAGATSFLGPGNGVGGSLGVTVTPMAGVSMSALARTFFRARTGDATYTAFLVPQRVADTDARYVGSAASLTALWRAHPKATVLATTEWFEPGAYLRAAPPADRSFFVRVQTRLAF